MHPSAVHAWLTHVSSTALDTRSAPHCMRFCALHTTSPGWLAVQSGSIVAQVPRLSPARVSQSWVLAQLPFAAQRYVPSQTRVSFFA